MIIITIIMLLTVLIAINIKEHALRNQRESQLIFFLEGIMKGIAF